MYNAEKYIAACLESLLAQTFTDFEVIIADDCSTDSSCAVVESYLPRFGGRLKLSHMKKNSGGPGAPCNKAIAHARGKYIYQMDNDDLLVNNALETLYVAAETFNADIVHTARHILFRDDPSNPFPAREKLFVTQSYLDKLAFDPDDTGERIKIFCMNGTDVPGWQKLVRRDLLIENEIAFQEDVKASQDISWTIELVYYAKRYLRLPQPIYLYRQHSDSVSQRERLGLESILYRGELLAKNIEFLCRFFDKQQFFQENPQYAWMLLDWLERRYATNFGRALLTVPPHEAQKVLAENFAEEFGAHGNLIAYLCTSANVLRLKERYYLEKIAELERRLKN